MSSSLRKRTGQSQQADRSATSFSDLSDDVLGIVYGRMEDGTSKRSFRHASSVTWKSPAINARISACTVGSVERPARALQDFPRHAELKEVCFFHQTNDVHLERVLREALGLRTSCLSTVSDIRLVDWINGDDVTDITAAILCVLFPKLVSGQLALHVEECHVEASFFRALAGRAHGLHKLSVCECLNFDMAGDFADEILPLLSGLPLTSLLLGFAGVDGRLPTQALAGLRQLNGLRIRNAEVEGFEEVLPQLTCLSILMLEDVRPTGMHLSSPCLHTLKLHRALPKLGEKRFPSLKRLQICSLDFDGFTELGDGSDGSVINALSDLVLCLSSLPVEVKLGDDNGKFSIWTVREDLVTPVLQALLPLRQLFEGVRCLTLEVAGITDDRSLALLSCVFQNLSVLHLSGCILPNRPTQDVHVSKFLENIRSLEVMRLPVRSAPPDLLATLLSAGLQRRAFVLELVVWNSTIRSGLQLVADLWQSSRHLFPSVDLKVV